MTEDQIDQVIAVLPCQVKLPNIGGSSYVCEAVATTRICRCDLRNRLRELHGFEPQFGCVKLKPATTQNTQPKERSQS